MYGYTYKHLHKITISEKGGYELEGERGGIYGKSWREEREARNAIISQNKCINKQKYDL